MSYADRELISLSMAEAGELLRAEKVSSLDLTRACLNRIEQYNPVLNAFITITTESASADAKAADEEIARGGYRGPLHGIPIALKDLIDTASFEKPARCFSGN
jgi:aspartyl-tRNA(Asn)/glutamyl-tRNA(Gln) amidotransferase subunit A